MSATPPAHGDHGEGTKVLSLDQISKGIRVRVRGIRDDGGSSPDEARAIARRLDDLGLREGVELEVLRRAPLGDPTVFELHGYQLCLRRSESTRVEVETIESTSDGRTRE